MFRARDALRGGTWPLEPHSASATRRLGPRISGHSGGAFLPVAAVGRSLRTGWGDSLLSVHAPERETAAATRQVHRREPVCWSPAADRVLALQRSAGNRAVASALSIQRCGCGAKRHGAEEECEECRARRLARAPASTQLLQRLTVEEKQQDLTSPRLAPNDRLQRAFDNSPAVHIGESGEAIRLLQQALVDDGFAMPKSTKPTGELDGGFGAETFAVVKEFQAKHGLTVDGIVGRETLGVLDGLELARGQEPLLKPKPGQEPSVLELPGGLQILIPGSGVIPERAPDPGLGSIPNLLGDVAKAGEVAAAAAQLFKIAEKAAAAAEEARRIAEAPARTAELAALITKLDVSHNKPTVERRWRPEVNPEKVVVGLFPKLQAGTPLAVTGTVELLADPDNAKLMFGFFQLCRPLEEKRAVYRSPSTGRTVVKDFSKVYRKHFPALDAFDPGEVFTLNKSVKVPASGGARSVTYEDPPRHTFKTTIGCDGVADFELVSIASSFTFFVTFAALRDGDDAPIPLKTFTWATKYSEDFKTKPRIGDVKRGATIIATPVRDCRTDAGCVSEPGFFRIAGKPVDPLNRCIHIADVDPPCEPGP